MGATVHRGRDDGTGLAVAQDTWGGGEGVNASSIERRVMQEGLRGQGCSVGPGGMQERSGALSPQP